MFRISNTQILTVIIYKGHAHIEKDQYRLMFENKKETNPCTASMSAAVQTINKS